MTTGTFDMALKTTPNKLSQQAKPSKAAAAFKKKKEQPVAESWDDEELDSGEDTNRPRSPEQSADYPSTPTSFARETFSTSFGYTIEDTGDSRSKGANLRPEKTDTVAKRMIFSALGVMAPKKTEEQRAFDRAMREKEIKRRNQEKEAAARAKEETERAKAALWDD